MKPDTWVKLALAALLTGGLALVAVPVLYALTHWNERGRGWDYE